MSREPDALAVADRARPAPDPAADAVLRDLVDAALQEGLVEATSPGADGWGRVGPLRARLRPGGRLQPWRLAGGPLLTDDDAAVPPAAALVLLELTGPGAGAVARDLAGARDLAAHLDAAFPHAPGETIDLLAGERIAALRGRPFHPTGRAVSGWSARDLDAFGPMRTDPVPAAWVSVRRDRLRHGPRADAHRLHDALLSDAEAAALDAAMVAAGVDADEFQPLPVHPWQARRTLPEHFASEIRRGDVVPLAPVLGRFHPTVSLRTMAVADARDRHLKLPLGVATLGAARLLPPRYLDNGDRAERVMHHVLSSAGVPAGLVQVCDEGCWAGWAGDEFGDRPGHLAAQLRRYPAGSVDASCVPMAALAADRGDLLGAALGDPDPTAFFAGLVEAFAVMVVAFLCHGVLPELHGQNVVVRLAPGGRAVGFVLRDHDTLRVHAPWMRRAGVPDPGYRVRPGAPQSLVLDSASALVGYAQTLGVQVNLYGIADALVRRHGIDEDALWECVQRGFERALADAPAPADVRDEIADLLLRAERWPSRTVLGPLLAGGPSSSVSMPAGTGSVPNPLLAGAGAEVRRR